MNRSEEQMRALIAARALEWFVAHRAGPLSEAEREEFIDWLRASPAHAQEYLALTGFVKDLRAAAQKVPTPAATLVSQARAEPDAAPPLPLFAAAAPEMHNEDSAPARSSFPTLRTAVAAVAALVVAVVLVGTWWLHESAGYSTAHAEQRSWRMPDGSTVHLNSSSKIRLRFDSERREVELIQGQALFQVAKDARRPFWVHAGDTVVKAVGTEFDVYRQSRGTLVSVVEGRVAVWRVQDESARMIESGGAAATTPIAQLDAGQQARISRDSAFVSNRAADVRKTVAWLQRQVVFDHDPLGNAVAEFNRYAQLRIRIDDTSLRAVEISGIFSAYDVESFIRFLERQPEMRVRRAGNEIVVTATPAAVL